MSVRCPSCLTSLRIGRPGERSEIEWWGGCSHRHDLVPPSEAFSTMLATGVRCRQCDGQLMELRPRDCGRALPGTLLEAQARKAYCLVIGIGRTSHYAADDAAALMMWRLQRAQLAGALRWAYANDEASRIWRMAAGLRRPGGDRFGREPLLLGVLDATGQPRGQAVVLVRSFEKDGDKLEAWLTSTDCRRQHKDALATRFGAVHQIVLCVRAEDLVGDAARAKLVEHARALAGVLARPQGPQAPRLFLLLVDRDERFFLNLGPGAATPRLCSERGKPEIWHRIADDYVFHNYRLAELLAAGGLDRGAMTPLYGSLPVEDERSLLGIEVWSENLLALLQ